MTQRMSMENRVLWIFLVVSVLAIVLTGYLLVAYGNPFVCDDAANTCTYRVTAQEPTKTSAGAALTNYKQTNIKVSINGGSFSTITKPATSATGGGTVIQDVTFATAACAKTTLAVKVSGTNTLNIEGAEAVATGSPVVRDRTLDPMCAPMAPTATVD